MITKRGNKLAIKDSDIEALKSGKLVWEDLIDKGVIEYIDAEEEENCLIALNTDYLTEKKKTHSYTHMEVDPLTILGVATSNVPFPEHNSAPEGWRHIITIIMDWSELRLTLAFRQFLE